jgi:hypothetical protein
VRDRLAVEHEALEGQGAQSVRDGHELGRPIPGRCGTTAEPCRRP